MGRESRAAGRVITEGTAVRSVVQDGLSECRVDRWNALISWRESCRGGNGRCEVLLMEDFGPVEEAADITNYISIYILLYPIVTIYIFGLKGLQFILVTLFGLRLPTLSFDPLGSFCGYTLYYDPIWL